MRFDQFLKEACPPLDLEWRKYRRRAARHQIAARLTELGLADYDAYLERLRSDSAEADGLAARMRITVSRFYREHERWDVLQEIVLPQLLQKKGPGEPLRTWSVGCCGGEEPYTLALLWLESLQQLSPGGRVEILATDIDAACLERARRAVYAAGSLREVPGPLLDKYFRKVDRLWQLDERVKSLVRFERRDLLDATPGHDLDLVCCRYLVFTYYRGRRRDEAARRLWQALRPGGALMIARKEALGVAAQLFEAWPGAEGVFRKVEERSRSGVSRPIGE